MSRAHESETHQPTAILRAEVIGLLAIRDRERKGSPAWREATDQFVYQIVAAAARYRAEGITTVKEERAARIQEIARLTQLVNQRECHCHDQED